MSLKNSLLSMTIALALAAAPAAWAVNPNGSVVNATGHGVYYGSVALSVQYNAGIGYSLIDNMRGGNVTSDAQFNSMYFASYMELQQFPSSTPVFGNGLSSNKASIGADAHYTLAATWDYFADQHDRLGIRVGGNGDEIFVDTNMARAAFRGHRNAGSYMNLSYIHTGIGAPQAGIGHFNTLDIVGREFALAVAERTVRNVNGDGEVGGVQDAFADAFGTLVEFNAAHPNDPGDYVIGELAVPGGIRQQYKQDLDGSSYVCYPAGGIPASAEGHHASGIGNRAFYLLAEGAVAPAGSALQPAQLVCNGDTTLAGIGRDKVGKIWYRAMTQQLTESTNYAQARRATITAADQLYGVGSAESRAVARAWSAVLVN